MAQHERVKRVYAHITDPLAAVELPERCKGAVLGLGGETDAEWRKRASEAATDALKGVQARWHRGVREKGLDEAEMLARTTQAVNRKVEEMEERARRPRPSRKQEPRTLGAKEQVKERRIALVEEVRSEKSPTSEHRIKSKDDAWDYGH